MVRDRVAAVALAAALVAGAAGCAGSSTGSSTGSSGSDSGPRSAVGNAEQPASFALALGVDADDPGERVPLAGYDLVVVDGAQTSAAAVRALQDEGATVLAYLSVGTVEPGRPWFATARDRGWLLDHWDDWDEWYAAVAEAGLRDLLVEEARTELARGFDGLFLDNTDMVQDHPDQRAGMVRVVADLDRLVGPDRLLVAQNGDPVAAGIVDHLDGWNREDVATTYDFDAEAYAAVSAEDHRAALADLQALHERGLIVMATDYSDGRDPAADDAHARSACTAGALPFVADIDLTRIADPPRRCDR